MRLKLLASAALIGSSTIVGINQPAEAQGTNFICASWRGVPTTIAQTTTGDIPVIRWVSNTFDEYDPITRCRIVSGEFQQAYNKGTLNYLTTGRKNGQNIVCVAQYEGGACDQQLFTLKTDSNPGQILVRLMAIRDRSAGPLNQSSDRIYVNMEEYLSSSTPIDSSYLENASVEPNIEPSAPVPNKTPSGNVW